MAENPTPTPIYKKVLLMYYSPGVVRDLEGILTRHNLEVFPVDGRASDAADVLRGHSADLVVIDCSAEDVSLSQAIRQVCHILPGSLVITVYPNRSEVGIYRGGRRVDVVETLGVALGAQV